MTVFKNCILLFMQNEKPCISVILSGNIRTRRSEKGFTQAQLAEKAGISIRHLSDIERSDSFPSPETIEKIASALDIPSYILFLPEDESRQEILLYSKVKTVLDEEVTKAIISTLERVREL